MINKQWLGDNIEGRIRDVFLRKYSDIRLVRLRKTSKTLRIAGLWADSWIQNFPNTKQECWPFGRDIRRASCMVLLFWGGRSARTSTGTLKRSGWVLYFDYTTRVGDPQTETTAQCWVLLPIWLSTVRQKKCSLHNYLLLHQIEVIFQRDSFWNSIL